MRQHLDDVSDGVRLRIREVGGPDGDCWYSSIAFMINGKTGGVKELREQLAQYIEENMDWLEKELLLDAEDENAGEEDDDEDDDEDEQMDDPNLPRLPTSVGLVKRIRRPGVWVEQPGIIATAFMLQRDIIVVSQYGDYSYQQFPNDEVRTFPEIPPLVVPYLDNNHYVATEEATSFEKGTGSGLRGQDLYIWQVNSAILDTFTKLRPLLIGPRPIPALLDVNFANFSVNLLTFRIVVQMVAGTGNRNLLGKDGGGKAPFAEHAKRYILLIRADKRLPLILPLDSSIQEQPNHWEIREVEFDEAINFNNFRRIIWNNECQRIADIGHQQYPLAGQGLNRNERGGVEFVSRRLSVSAISADLVAEELRRVCGAFRSLFYTYTPSEIHRLTTGLHVHIGVGRGRTIAAGPLRVLMAILVLYEEVIDEMHPLWRCDDRFRYSYGHLATHRYSQYVPRKEEIVSRGDILPLCDMTDDAAFDAIMQQRTVEQVMRRTCPGDNVYGRYLFHLDLGSLEFRQHESTEDKRAIEMWLLVVSRIVAIAYQVSDRTREKIFRGMLTSPIKSLQRFLGPKFLDLPQHVVRYWLRKAAQNFAGKRAWKQVQIPFPTVFPEESSDSNQSASGNSSKEPQKKFPPPKNNDESSSKPSEESPKKTPPEGSNESSKDGEFCETEFEGLEDQELSDESDFSSSSKKSQKSDDQPKDSKEGQHPKKATQKKRKKKEYTEEQIASKKRKLRWQSGFCKAELSGLPSSKDSNAQDSSTNIDDPYTQKTEAERTAEDRLSIFLKGSGVSQWRF